MQMKMKMRVNVVIFIICIDWSRDEFVGIIGSSMSITDGVGF